MIASLEMRVTLPACLQAIEEFIVDFRRWSRTLPDPPVGFAAELLLREALTNAVVHGSGSDRGKQVRCCLRFKGGRLLIAVEDDGDGFDWRAARQEPAGLLDSCGRGVGILFQYADRTRFNNNGNAVTMIKQSLKDSQ